MFYFLKMERKLRYCIRVPAPSSSPSPLINNDSPFYTCVKKKIKKRRNFSLQPNTLTFYLPFFQFLSLSLRCPFCFSVHCTLHLACPLLSSHNISDFLFT